MSFSPGTLHRASSILLHTPLGSKNVQTGIERVQIQRPHSLILVRALFNICRNNPPAPLHLSSPTTSSIFRSHDVAPSSRALTAAAAHPAYLPTTFVMVNHAPIHDSMLNSTAEIGIKLCEQNQRSVRTCLSPETFDHIIQIQPQKARSVGGTDVKARGSDQRHTRKDQRTG